MAAVLAPAAPRVPWPVVWAGAFVAVVLAVGLSRLRSQEPEAQRSTLGWPTHAFAALVGLGFAAMSLFINRPNADDAYYVNRATATAELNRIPVRDVLFTDELVPPTSGAGLPVDTFSAFQGALGHFIGIHAASFAYYITPPLMTFFAVWALWRVLRSWAPRNVVLCFALGCTYWLFSAQSELTAGSYFLTRMWQGKVIFVAWLVPTAYVYLTRWLGQRDAFTAVLLLAAGTSSIGMTASASYVAPLLFTTAVVPLLARREWGGLPVLIAAAAVPLFVGVVATQKYPLVERLVAGVPHGASWYFDAVFGAGVLAALGVIGLWTAPWVARAGPAAGLATGIAVVSLLLLAPLVLRTLSDVAGLSGPLRRTLWIVPLPAVVGLLGAIPVAQLLRRFAAEAPARLGRLAAAAPALLVAGMLLAFGQSLWTSRSGEALWAERPMWKTNRHALANARDILAGYRGDGPVLADQRTMGAIALVTVRPKAVNARKWYAILTPEPPSRTSDRLALTRFVEGREPKPSPQKVRRALSDLQVGLVCVDGSKPLVIREVETNGYSEAFRFRDVVCLRRSQA